MHTSEVQSISGGGGGNACLDCGSGASDGGNDCLVCGIRDGEGINDCLGSDICEGGIIGALGPMCKNPEGEAIGG